MDGTCLAAGKVAGVQTFEGGEGTTAEMGVVEDLVEVKSERCFKEIVHSGV